MPPQCLFEGVSLYISDFDGSIRSPCCKNILFENLETANALTGCQLTLGQEMA